MRQFLPIFIRITAMQLEGELNYHKWGSEQHAKPGDWIVNKGGEVYSIDADSFDETYTPTDDGGYAKTSPVWAYQAQADGEVETKEGVSQYKAGDMVVSNNEDGTDSYCMTIDKFQDMYEPA